MAVPPQFIFIATNLSTGAVIDEIPFAQAMFTRAYNKPGTFTGQVPIESPIGSLNRVTRSLLAPASTCVWVLSHGKPVWGGIVWNTSANVQARTISVNASGFFSYLNKRVLTEDITYASPSIDQTLIVEGLIDWANNVSGGDIGMSVDYPTGVSGILREKKFKAFDMNTISELIDDLVSAEFGIEWAEEFTGNITSLQHYIRLSYPRRGSNTGLVLDTTRNAEMMSWDINGEYFANRAHGFNIADDEKIRTTQSEPLNGNSLQETAVAFTDEVSVFELEHKTRQHLQRRAIAPTTVTLSVDANDLDVGLGTFIAGDIVRVVSELGYVSIDRNYRIMNYTTNIDTRNDLSTITVTLMDARLFD